MKAGNTNKNENYLTEGSQQEWGSMRFCPPNQWDIKPNREWFGLVHLINMLDLVDGHMIEIGTYAGESTMMFASSNKFKKIHTIDPYDFPQGYQVLMEARINTRYWYNIHFYKTWSHKIHNHFKDECFDLVYIDGDHSRDAVLQDLELYYPKVKEGRYIAGHDYNDKEWPETYDSINYFFKKKGYSFDDIWKFEDSSWCVRKNSS